jgi:hypothetical protein
VWDYLFSPEVQSFPKLPFIKHHVPVGPHGSVFLKGEMDAPCNQFGVTDKSKDFEGVSDRVTDDTIRPSSSCSDDDDDDEDDDVDARGAGMKGRGGAGAGAGWIQSKFHDNQQVAENDDDDDDSDSDPNETKVVTNININSAPDEDESGQGDQNVQLWRDSGPLTPEDKYQEQHPAQHSHEDSDECEQEKMDLFDSVLPYVTSEEHTEDDDEEDEEDDDESIEVWPFASEALLLKLGCVMVAMLFKVRAMTIGEL